MNCTDSRQARQAATHTRGTDRALVVHQATRLSALCCPLCADVMKPQADQHVCPRCQWTQPNPVLAPSLSDTLALWRSRFAAVRIPLTVQMALSQMAHGHPAGTRHQGYQRHVANTRILIAAGELVIVREWNGKPAYRPAALGSVAAEDLSALPLTACCECGDDSEAVQERLIEIREGRWACGPCRDALEMEARNEEYCRERDAEANHAYGVSEADAIYCCGRYGKVALR